jgi:hypothetical protein
MKTTAIYCIIFLISLKSFSQSIEIKGVVIGKTIDYQSTKVHGTLYANQIDIGFTLIPLVNIEAFEIYKLNYSQNINGKTFKIVDKINNDNQVRIELNIDKTCGGDIICKNGIIAIEKFSCEHIEASGFIIFENDTNQFYSYQNHDTLEFIINTPLYNAIQKYPYEKLDSNYHFGNVELSGVLYQKFKNSSNSNENTFYGQFKFKSLRHIELEIEDEMLEIDLFSGFDSRYEFSHTNRFDKKLEPGEYEIIPLPVIEDSLDYMKFLKSIKINQIAGQIEKVKKYEDNPVSGVLIIEHISDKRCKGSFDLEIAVNDKKEILKGKFEVPVKVY